MLTFGPADNPQYVAAVKTLLNVCREFGAELLDRAHAEVVGPLRLEGWKGGGLVEVEGQACVHELLGRTHPKGSTTEDCRPPVVGRPSVWADEDGKAKFYAVQAGALDLRTVERLAQYSRRLGLGFTVEAERAWHFPGRSILIVLWADRDASVRP